MKFIKYPKVRQIGQDGTEDILTKDHVIVQPKVDGSNVSVYLFAGEETRIARRQDFIEKGHRQFSEFVKWAEEKEPEWERIRRLLSSGQGLVFYGEYSNNQNKLKYTDKVPFILFDILFFSEQFPDGIFLQPDVVKTYAELAGIFVTPTLYEGPGSELTVEKLNEMADRDAFLGGCKEEGIVIKHYEGLTRYNRPYFCKVVTEHFQEVRHQKEPQNVMSEELGNWIADSFFTPARLEKAIQRMKEDGTWNEENIRKNIGPLIGEVSQDIREEHWEEIKEHVAKQVWKSGAKKIAQRVSPTLDELAKRDMEYFDNVVGD